MFSIKESVKYGWYKSKEHMKLVLFATLLVLAISSLTGGVGDHKGLGVSLFGILATIFLIIVKIGYTKIFLRIYDGESPKFVEMFEEYRIFWRYLGVSILFMLTFVGGLVLLIIPGIFWAVRFSFSLLIVIDTKIGPIAAMKESYSITKNNFWKILLFIIVSLFINILGLILLGVGLLVTVPVTTFAFIYIYRQLSKIKAGLIQNPSPQTA
jgi:uncharacterized membrane protein